MCFLGWVGVVCTSGKRGPGSGLALMCDGVCLCVCLAKCLAVCVVSGREKKWRGCVWLCVHMCVCVSSSV